MPKRTNRIVAFAALALIAASCAQQQAAVPPPAPVSPAAGSMPQGMPEMRGMQNNMAPMGGMQHDISQMDMQGMAQHCAAMRRQQTQGIRLSPDMRQMLGQCDQMDRSMGTRAPAATLER